MLTKTIVGVTAAAFIAAGSLGATTSTANAGVYIGGPGIYFGFGPAWGWGPGPYWGPYPYPYPYPGCRAVPVKVKWYDKKGRKHWSTKWVRRCW
jgi:hypothetical protein